MAAFDAPAFRKSLKAAAKKAFARAQKLPDVCSYALCSDSDAMTVSATINTASHLQKQEAKDDDATYRFSPAEWANEGFANELFEPLQRKLRAEAKSTQTASEWSDLRDAVFESCVSVLEELRAEGAFGTPPTALIVFAVSDWQEARREKRWMKRLNSPATYKAFARWLDD